MLEAEHYALTYATVGEDSSDSERYELMRSFIYKVQISMSRSALEQEACRKSCGALSGSPVVCAITEPCLTHWRCSILNVRFFNKVYGTWNLKKYKMIEIIPCFFSINILETLLDVGDKINLSTHMWPRIWTFLRRETEWEESWVQQHHACIMFLYSWNLS